MYGTCGRIDNKADFDFDLTFEKWGRNAVTLFSSRGRLFIFVVFCLFVWLVGFLYSVALLCSFGGHLVERKMQRHLSNWCDLR